MDPVTFVSFVMPCTTLELRRAAASVPLQPAVIDTDLSSDAAGVPPSVIVTFVSSVFDSVPGVVHVIADAPPPADVRRSPDDPAVVGRLKLYVPAAACGCIVIVPLLLPLIDATRK